MLEGRAGGLGGLRRAALKIDGVRMREDDEKRAGLWLVRSSTNQSERPVLWTTVEGVSELGDTASLRKFLENGSSQPEGNETLREAARTKYSSAEFDALANDKWTLSGVEALLGALK